MRIFWKLFATCAGVGLLGAIVLAFLLSQWQERQAFEQWDQRLRDAAILVRGDLGQLMDEGASEKLQARARELGDETHTRYTLVALDGTVLADSSKRSLVEVATLENHRHRPEILRAMSGEEGSIERDSATMSAPYRYVALKVDVDGKAVGVVRAGVPMDVIWNEISAAKRWIWGLVIGVSLAGLAFSYVALRLLLNPLTALTEAAEAIAAGDYEHRVYVENQDELGRLGRTFNRMSQDLHRRMTQLSQTSDHQTTVLEGMVEGVIAVDERQRIVLANKAAGRLLEFRPEAVEGRPLMEVARNHALHQAVTTAIFTRRSQRVETKREGTDKLIADVHVTPLPGDPCPGVVLVMHDTTELRRLESLRRDFVANVSHELKTPLSSIKAYAETLRNGALHDPDASHKFLERIEEQADRLHRLILDLLMIARVESAQQVFEIVSVAVGEVAAACVEDRQQAAAAKSIQLLIEPNLSPCVVHADREGLREILDNLVDNAIKYTPNGGKVVVRWRCKQGVCHLAVEDTGIGIGPEDRKRVFERFYRVDKARSRELGGTGLGLAIVKHLAQAFGGKVMVDSEPGRGSVFTVQLPVARA